MIPAWAKIKDEMLNTRTNCLYYLTQYRNQNCLNHRISFATQTMHLYELIRPKLKYIENTGKGKYKHLKNTLDPLTSPPTQPKMTKWLQLFRDLEDAMEELGVTKIEIPVEPTMEPEEAWKEGLPVNIID